MSSHFISHWHSDNESMNKFLEQGSQALRRTLQVICCPSALMYSAISHEIRLQWERPGSTY